jgi:hypothetical protein
MVSNAALRLGAMDCIRGPGLGILAGAFNGSSDSINYSSDSASVSSPIFYSTLAICSISW